MKKLSTKSIAIYAIITALVMVATYAVKFPTPATNGYANLGDAFVMYCGVVFGPIIGFLVGGAGSALADLAGGYAHWILPTFVIKGVEGAVSGLLFLLLKKGIKNRFVSAGISSFVAAILMIAGYFLASTIMKGSAAVALTSVPANCVQGAVGVAVSLLLLIATYKIRGFASLLGNNNFYLDTPSHKETVQDTEDKDMDTEKNDVEQNDEERKE